MAKQEFTDAQKVELLQLARQLDAAKAAELECKTARVKIETMLENAIECPEEGQVTIQLPNGSSVCIKRALNYKTDFNAINEMIHDLNASCVDKTKRLFCPLKWNTKAELDRKGYEWYRLNKPVLFKMIAEHVTVKPAKTQVTRK